MYINLSLLNIHLNNIVCKKETLQSSIGGIFFVFEIFPSTGFIRKVKLTV